jgi:pimeloyl-ACP methyl ester carboxylesterase
MPIQLDPPSVSELHWICGAASLVLSPGDRREFTFPVVIQPSNATTMQVHAQWGAANLFAQIAIPQAHIHPVVVIPGILGTLPPTDDAPLDPVLGVYDPLILQLQQMGYEPGKTLFPMPYDWRQSNVITAGKLKTRIDTAIATSRNVGWIDPGAQVDIVAHSMGGLVTRTYVQGFGKNALGAPVAYAHDIRKVVFVASPHRGFPEIYKTYESASWSDFLYDHGVLLWAMDKILWPAFVRKHWSQTNPLRSEQVSCALGGPAPPGVDCAFDIDRMVHDSRGGMDSMREMLPTDDVSQTLAPFAGPWLCLDYVNNVCQTPFPYGNPRNPLLNTLNLGVDASLSTALGAQNIYVVYGTDPNPGDAAGFDSVDVVYDLQNVVLPPPAPGAPPPPVGTPLPPPWRNGKPAATFRTQQGDDLIPSYSANLGLLMPSLDPAHIVHLTGQGARHKQLMANETLLRAKLPQALSGQDLFPFANRYEQPLLFLRGSQYYVLVNLCPVNLLLTQQSTGKRIGYDGETGQFFNEIPGVYSGANADNQFMLLGDLPEGNYTVKLSAFGTGEFTVSFHEVIPGHGTPTRWVKQGFVKAGQLLTFSDLVVRKRLPISTQPPRLRVGPPQSLTAGPNCSAPVTLDATGSTDPSGEALQLSWMGRFAGVFQTIYGVTRQVQMLVGTHNVTLLGVNGEGRAAKADIGVIVHPPLAAVPAALQPADNTLRDVTIDMAQAAHCGTTYCAVQKIESNGGVAQDFQIVAPLKVRLRAAHNAGAAARVYTVTLMCLHWGRWMFNTVQVRVP